MEELDRVETEFSFYQNKEFESENFDRIDEIWHKISLIKTERRKTKYEFFVNRKN